MKVLLLGGVPAVSVFVLVYLFVIHAGSRSRNTLFLTGPSPSLQAQLDRNNGSVITSVALQAADLLIPQKRKGSTEMLLQVAGMPFRPAEWLLFRASAAVVLGVVLLLVGSVPLS